uniref:SREBP regulating gene protein n=1 Tax=Tetraselmis sp. GSL018 TaxID=582737 RepID=A0A061SG01_9CHLO
MTGIVRREMNILLSTVFWLFCCDVIPSLGETHTTSAHYRRQLLARPVREKQQCQNTAAGRWLLADSNGMVCKLDQVNAVSGCCEGGSKHSCETCLEVDKCCTEYEHCVSCCLKQDHTPASALAANFRSAGRPETGKWGSRFELCRGKCRTTSQSTVHENSYLGRRHHCFGDRQKPMLEPELAPPPGGVVAVAAQEPNLSCLQVCAGVGKTCSPDHFDAVNHCDRLRDHFKCEAGCQLSTASTRGKDHPAYVIYQSPKENFPTMCLINELREFDCSAKHAKTRRLCPCV